jgi:calcineurin-like phosphoesterase family protein
MSLNAFRNTIRRANFKLVTLFLYYKHRNRKTVVRWFTSDWHFGHRNVINYCDRPWNHINDMDKDLVDRWNATVQPQDTVYFLGDFAFNWKKPEEISPLLNGRKILVAGNHDKCFSMSGEISHEKEKRYLGMGWAEVHQILKINLKDSTRALLSHLPYLDNHSKEYDIRYKKQRPIRGEEDVLIHGHHHCKYLKKDNKIDVGIDNNFKLLSEDEIINLYMKGKPFVKARLSKNGSPHKEEM